MVVEKELISLLLSNSGQLPEGTTWYDLAVRFGVEVHDKERAKTDETYRRKNMGRSAQRIWQKYIRQQNKLKLNKQIYDGKGNLLWETFKDKPDNIDPIDPNQYDIERITTNPYGGAWFKMKRKENIYTEEHFEHLRDMLTKHIEPFSMPVVNKANDEGLFILSSDKHIGALTKLDSIYKNLYTKEEIKKRLLANTILEIEKWVFKFGTFDTLFIMDLGDALDGFNQKTTGGLRGTSSHILPQQLNNREQHDFYVEVHRELFDYIMPMGYAKQVNFIATSNSNHGGDFEYSAMRTLETYLELKYPQVKTYVNYKPLNHFIYGNHAIIFGHGKDDEDMKHGFPLTLTDKVEKVLSDYIRVNDLNKYNVRVITGDLHQSCNMYGKNFRYRKVLSQYGSSKWMHTNFGSGSPGLSSEVFEKNSNKIYLTDDFFEIENQSNTGVQL